MHHIILTEDLQEYYKGYLIIMEMVQQYLLNQMLDQLINVYSILVILIQIKSKKDFLFLLVNFMF